MGDIGHVVCRVVAEMANRREREHDTGIAERLCKREKGNLKCIDHIHLLYLSRFRICTILTHGSLTHDDIKVDQ